MKIDFAKLKNYVNLKNFPAAFEHYEIFVVLTGIVIVIFLAEWIFYDKAYKTTTVPPSVSFSLPRINKVLFDEIFQEIKEKEQPLPASEPVVDPFR